MLIKQWMTSKVVSVTPSTPLLKCQSMLREMNIAHLPVVDEEDRVVGLLSFSTIKEFSPQKTTPLEVLEFLDILSETPASKLMVKDPPTVHIDDTVENAAVLMVDTHKSVLPIVDSKGVLKGIITQWDIFKTFVEITGTRTTKSVQMAFVLENKAGTLRAILTRLRETDTRVVTVLSNIRDDGRRGVTLRFLAPNPETEEMLIKEFCAQGTVQYWGRGSEVNIVGDNNI